MDPLQRFGTYVIWLLIPGWPFAIAVLGILAVGVVRPSGSGQRAGARGIAAFGMLLVWPLVVLLWGAIAFNWSPRGKPLWPQYIAALLALGEGVLALALVRRYRMVAGYAIPPFLVGTAGTLLALFIAFMSIVNDWI